VPTDRPSYHESGWVADLTDEQRCALWNNGLDAMASINQLDWRDGFQFLDIDGDGSPSLQRYLQWIDEWYDWARAGREQPVMDVAMRAVHERMPAYGDVAVLWGDSRIGNIIFDDDMAVAALLDWEMAALGPAEVDLGWWLFMDRLAAEARNLPRLPGFPDSAETIGRYERQIGRSVRDVEFFELLGGVRMSIVVIRYADVCVQHGLLPVNTNVGTNNPATRIVARILGLPEPELSSETGKNRPLVAET
jgi:aminoglycoside phosphotransferase (APT) family kinase protein